MNKYRTKSVAWFLIFLFVCAPLVFLAEEAIALSLSEIDNRIVLLKFDVHEIIDSDVGTDKVVFYNLEENRLLLFAENVDSIGTRTNQGKYYSNNASLGKSEGNKINHKPYLEGMLIGGVAGILIGGIGMLKGGHIYDGIIGGAIGAVLGLGVVQAVF